MMNCVYFVGENDPFMLKKNKRHSFLSEDESLHRVTAAATRVISLITMPFTRSD